MPRLGLGHLETLLEGLDAREIAWTDTTFVGNKTTVDNSTLTSGSGTTTTLTRAQSGTHFNVNGTDDNVINLPALSTSNVGVSYAFMLTTATASGKTTIFVLPGSGVSNFYATIFDAGAGSEPTVDVAGDTLTLVASTAVGSRVHLLCVADDGTNSTWQAMIHADTTSTVD